MMNLVVNLTDTLLTEMLSLRKENLEEAYRTNYRKD